MSDRRQMRRSLQNNSDSANYSHGQYADTGLSSSPACFVLSSATPLPEPKKAPTRASHSKWPAGLCDPPPGFDPGKQGWRRFPDSRIPDPQSNPAL